MELLERKAQLATLTELLHEAAAGTGRLIFVGGEAGVGKTALVQHFCASVRAQASVLVGACDPLSTPRPLGPVFDLAIQTGGDLAQVLQDATSRERIFGSVLAELSTGPRPHLVLLEDVHWADEATLDLLRFLARRLVPLRVLLVATYREDEIGPQHPLRIVLGDVATAGVVRRMSVSPLSAAAVGTLAAGSGLDPVELYRRTDGNPFFVTEVLAARTRGVPATVRDAVLARVARLPARARGVVEATAVIGPHAEVRLLQRITDADSATLDACVHVGVLLAAGNRLAFRHELARAVVLEALPAHRQMDLHRRVLEVLTESGVDRSALALVAHHAEGAGDGAAVLEFAPAAARRASALGAHREAAAQYARALRWADQLESRKRALVLEGQSFECYVTALGAEAIEARQAALKIWRELGEREREGDNLRWLSRMYWQTGRNADAERASRAALEVLEALPAGLPLGWAYSNQAQLRMLSSDDAEAADCAERAILLARELGAADLLAHAGINLGGARLHRGDERGIEDLEASLAISLEHGFEEHAVRASVVLSTSLARMFQLDRAERYLDQGIAYAHEHDLDGYRLYLLSWRAIILFQRGCWDSALDVAGEIARAPVQTAVSRIGALTVIGRVHARRGEPDVWDALDEALSLAEQIGELHRVAPVRAARAEAAWLGGEVARSVAEAKPGFQLAAQKRDPWLGAELALWLWQAGELSHQPPDLPEPFARQIAGDWEGAAGWWQAHGCPYEQAHVLAQAEDVAHIRQALEIAEQLGARLLASTLLTRLHDLGVRIPPAVTQTSAASSRQLPVAPLGLSARESEVAALVAQGCTNREIARRLVVSDRTAENHVQRILNRLGLRSRTHLAAWAVQHGLGESDVSAS